MKRSSGWMKDIKEIDVRERENEEESSISIPSSQEQMVPFLFIWNSSFLFSLLMIIIDNLLPSWNSSFSLSLPFPSSPTHADEHFFYGTSPETCRSQWSWPFTDRRPHFDCCSPSTDRPSTDKTMKREVTVDGGGGGPTRPSDKDKWKLQKWCQIPIPRNTVHRRPCLFRCQMTWSWSSLPLPSSRRMNNWTRWCWVNGTTRPTEQHGTECRESFTFRFPVQASQWMDQFLVALAFAWTSSPVVSWPPLNDTLQIFRLLPFNTSSSSPSHFIIQIDVQSTFCSFSWTDGQTDEWGCGGILGCGELCMISSAY